MLTPNFRVTQTDDGKIISIIDTTTFGTPTVGTVTEVEITIRTDDDNDLVGDTQIYNHTFTFTNPAQSDLVFDIENTDCGFNSDTPFTDDDYEVVYRIKADGVDYTSTIYVYLDYNSRYYNFRLLTEYIPYKYPNGMAFDEYIQRYILFDTLVTGAQASAAVGQRQKLNDILEEIDAYRDTIDLE